MITLSLIEIEQPDVDEPIEANVAYVAAAGLDGVAYLRSGDPLEQELLLDAARRLHEYRATERHNLAVEIANCVGELFG